LSLFSTYQAIYLFKILIKPTSHQSSHSLMSHFWTSSQGHSSHEHSSHSWHHATSLLNGHWLGLGMNWGWSWWRLACGSWSGWVSVSETAWKFMVILKILVGCTSASSSWHESWAVFWGWFEFFLFIIFIWDWKFPYKLWNLQ